MYIEQQNVIIIYHNLIQLLLNILTYYCLLILLTIWLPMFSRIVYIQYDYSKYSIKYKEPQHFVSIFLINIFINWL